MINFLAQIYSCINSSAFVLLAISLSFCVKIYLLTILIPHGLHNFKIRKPWIYLSGVLLGSMVGDAAWIIKLLRELHIISLSFPSLIFVIRLSWGFMVLQYQSLALFMESITFKHFRLGPINQVIVTASTIIGCYFIAIAFFDTSLTDLASRRAAFDIQDTTFAQLEIQMMRYVVYYLHPLQLIPSLIVTFHRLFTAHLPKILRKQLRVILLFFIMPYTIIEACQATQFTLYVFQVNLYAIVAISTLLIAFCIHYCIRTIMQLRFLNVEDHVTRPFYNPNFFHKFKNILEQLSHATGIQELSGLTQTFFKDAFGCGLRKTTLHIRGFSTNQVGMTSMEPYAIESIVEPFMNSYDTELQMYINQRRILMYDEVEFSNFYNETKLNKTLLMFLETINADVFLPLYNKNNMIGYIIIERGARERQLYGSIERDEMLIVARYLASIINLMEHRSLTTLLHKEKELKEELHRKHQEINQYKESIKSFLRGPEHKEIGIIFYRNRSFSFGNTTAKKLLTINPNAQEGHPLAKAIKKVALQVTSYKIPQTSFITMPDMRKLIIYGVPHLEQQTVIIMLYYPEVSDIIARTITFLQDPTKWDYLLYLETTKSGQLINQLIPGSGKTLLNFKIDLLKAALSQKAIFLDMPEPDIASTVEIMHHISLRERLFTLPIMHDTKPATVATQLFGINTLINNHASHSLLGELDGNGTLFIKNIDLLDLEIQRYLVEFLQCGLYRIYKTDQLKPANVRVLCSASQPLEPLIHAGTFLQDLFDELIRLSLPSLNTLPETELTRLTEEFTSQLIQTHTAPTLLELTEKEKSRFVHKRPVSLHDLKERIQELVMQKSKHQPKIFQETQLPEDSYNTNDTDLTAIGQLGRKALRDPKIMALLLDRFKNQNQLASFLGVNRSSINRRVKEYGLR